MFLNGIRLRSSWVGPTDIAPAALACTGICNFNVAELGPLTSRVTPNPLLCTGPTRPASRP
eukprot:11181713-Lingulodinium_polyedra.AAC.1